MIRSFYFKAFQSQNFFRASLGTQSIILFGQFLLLICSLDFMLLLLLQVTQKLFFQLLLVLMVNSWRVVLVIPLSEYGTLILKHLCTHVQVWYLRTS